MKYSLFFLSIFVVFSCKTTPQTDAATEQQVINDCFIDAIDTLAYTYHSVRSAPNDTAVISTDSIMIGVYNRMVVPPYWKSAISDALNQLSGSFPSKKEYLHLLEQSGLDTMERDLNIGLITNTGKYQLIPEDKINSHRVPGRIGSVAFSRVYLDRNKGIGLFIVSIKDNFRSGIEKLVLVKNNNGLWKKATEIIIDTW